MGKGHFTATSGAMFVASRLSFEHQLHVELTRDNAPWVDLVVSTEDGSCALGVQVKAARDALRLRGRGREKRPSHYEWETGKKLMTEARPDLLVVLVDLKEWREMPDFFVVQACEIQAYYQQWQTEHPGKDPGRWIYKPEVAKMDTLKNDPMPLIDRLCEGRYSRDWRSQ